MSAKYVEQITAPTEVTTEMYEIASSGAQRIIERDIYTRKLGKYPQIRAINYQFFERLFLEGLMQNMQVHLIAKYIEALINYQDLTPLIEKNSSWDAVRREINISRARQICQLGVNTRDIPCRCGVGEPHTFYTDYSEKETCQHNTVVYETVSCEYVNGIYDIENKEKLRDIINKHRFARPPLRFKYFDFSSYSARELIADFNCINCAAHSFFEDRDEAFDFDYFIYEIGDFIPPVRKWEFLPVSDMEEARRIYVCDHVKFEPPAKKRHC